MAGNVTPDGTHGTSVLSFADIVHVVLLPLLMASAFVLSDAGGRRIARACAWLRARLKPGSHLQDIDSARMFPVQSPDALALEMRSFHFMERLHLLAQYSPVRSDPHIRIEGRAHLKKALSDGRGAVLWVVPTSWHSLESKRAFADMGFAPAHLTRRDHGFSGTRFGMAVLNPIRARIERRYLRHRIVFESAHVRAALAEIARRLEANEPVSITVGRRARSAITVPFLQGAIRAATRPVHLAHDSGAKLLPVITVLEDGGSYLTVIGPDLLAGSKPGEPDARAVIAKLAAFMEPYARYHPAQFAGMPILEARA